ncbi:hypothetical protein CSE16_11885 [Solibacillus sp. R5-41]|uniref:hypothetical protein n=1 Tax=Solibacillus sp. R5-41 TaxID=2048654 RepID=UPI000C127B95|nr:hypothetical protein [Solibacillus sp. R5-41]ATP40691.1 hypothetical protein CSE16_11885 [Solibacillus sp. R5-41]
MNIKVGWRFIFDQDGNIIHTEGECSGDVLSRKELTSIDYIDLEYGEIDLTKWDVVGIDTVTLKPILVEKPIYETEEQRRIRELEDELLLQTENEFGGIL